ncbi:MAG TPA: TolC family protein [Pyrinomonadaceae bacterium]|nr:TolC family protein [Pyrinomonadaceae bacterium]
MAVSLGLGLVNLGLASSVPAQSQTNSVVAPILLTGSGEPLTLSQAVEIALAKNPLTRVTAGGRQLADAQLAAARATRWPFLQASETVTRSNNPVFVFGSLLEQGRFGADNFLLSSLNNPDGITNFRAVLSVRVPVFDQRQSQARIDLARLSQQQADQQTELIAQQIRFDVLKSYYGVLLAESRVVVAEEAIQIATADLKRIKDKFETGFVVRSDLLAAQVQLSEFRQQKIQALGELAIAQAALNTALGLPVNLSHTITDQLSERIFNVEAPDELIRLALTHRPEYARALLAVRMNARQVRGARDEVLPRVDAYTSLGISGRSPVTGSSDYAMGASVTVNLFDAGRKARINQARAAGAIAEAEQEQLANQISFEVVRAYQQFVSARERLHVVGQTSAQATEVLRIVRDRYHEGLTTITEVLRAELTLVRARTDVLTARHDHYVTYANVLLATGRLKDVQPFVF